MKTIIVINGHSNAGKNAVCVATASQHKTLNVSAMDPIKVAARTLGWDGDNSPEGREFLADIKRLSARYNDGPTEYLLERTREFLEGDAEIMFVHIRDPKGICHYVALAPVPVVTLLVRRPGYERKPENDADDNVEMYPYDCVFINNGKLDALPLDFEIFLRTKIYVQQRRLHYDYNLL